MASTYSTSLRLELMATGDQSGTWGTTTNTNLGTLLEQAITGVLSVAEGDTTLTLSTANGGSDQARNAVVNLTGAMTANRNVVVQTANKLYLIKNSTTGGFSIVVKTAAGAGVTIPPSSSQWVYSDGTDVIAGLIGNMPYNNLLQGYTTTATAGATTTLTVTSTHTQYFTGATTQTISLPVVSTLVLGQEFEIINLSSGALTVNSSGGNLVSTVSASSSVRVQVIAVTGTSAASWNAISVNLSSYLLLAGGTMTGPLTITGSSSGYTPLVLTSTEAGAAAGPIENNFRDSASPAASDILGRYLFNGRDSAANIQEYASIQAVIVSPTSTSEASTLDFYTQKGGSRVLSASLAGPVANFTSVAEGYTTTATAAGTTTLTVSSNQQQFFTGVTTQTVVLPVTSTLVLGQTYRVVNRSAGVVTVQSSGANTVYALANNESVIVTCILTSGTTAASWTAAPAPITLGYACRAWVNFDGTGSVSIRGSGNVSSITDNGVGNWTVNFATAMPDTNYCIALAITTASNGSSISVPSIASYTTGGCTVNSSNPTSPFTTDTAQVHVAIFR